jgi:hypothetical protein
MKFIKMVAAIVFIAFLIFKFFEHRFIMSLLPQGIATHNILYSQTSNFGFGPGGNETGIHIYRLSPSLKKDLENSGISALESFKRSKKHKHKVTFTWHETPILPSRHWVNYMSAKSEADYDKMKVTIENRLNAYGFGIKIDTYWKNIINEAINKKGSYHSYNSIIIPAHNIVVYYYAG